MNAAVLNEDKTFDLQPQATADLKPGQARIEVAWCGVCGTDLHIFKGHMDQRVPFPAVIGHEASGTVREVGAGVTNVKAGDTVVVRPLDACGECQACQRGFGHVCSKLNFIGIDSPGAFQQHWDVPAELLHHLPASMDLKLAAFVEPLAVACHDVRMSGIESGQTAVVLGGGPIGLLIAMTAKAAGARVMISEVSESRLALIESLGITGANPIKDDLEAAVQAHTEANGADVVFEVSGAAAPIQQMTKLACVRGKVVVVAIVPQPTPVDLFQVFWKELQIIGTRVYEPEDYDRAIELLASGAVDPSPLITGAFPLSEINGAFESLTQDATHMKVLIDCQG